MLFKTGVSWRVGRGLTFCLRKSKGKKEPARCPFGGVELVSFLPFHLYADWFIPFATALLELCRLRRAWEGDDVANVLHAGNEEDEPFEAQTETSVGA